MHPVEALRMKQLPLRLGAGAVQSFDNFVPGANGAALVALRAAAAAGGPVAPVYLWGEAGVGKTHLLNACRLQAMSAAGRVCAFTGEQAAPWAWEDGCTLLVLDGCDAFDGAQQHAAFALFVEATTARVPVVAAGRLPPVDLPVREDLRTRLGWGLVFHVQPASEPDARQALRREAARRGVPLSEDVIDYLFTHFQRDLGSLMAWLEALDDFSLSEKRSVTVPLLKRMLVPADVAAPIAAATDTSS